MSKETIEGKIEETGGYVRRKVGELTGDHEGEARGALDEVKGNLKKNYGKAKDAIKEAAE